MVPPVNITRNSERFILMATRLYPNTDNVTLLELLAGVPFGTADSVKNVTEEVLASLDGQADIYPLGSALPTNDKTQAIWKAIHCEPSRLYLAHYDHFITYGYGKFDIAGLDWDAGKTSGLEQASAILFANQKTGANIQRFHQISLDGDGAPETVFYADCLEGEPMENHHDHTMLTHLEYQTLLLRVGFCWS